MTPRRLAPLNWSQRVTMRMIAAGRSPAGGSSYLDTTGLGIPGGTIRSLRYRGLIEPHSLVEDRTWVLSKAGHEAFANGECNEPEDRELLRAPDDSTCFQPECTAMGTRQSYATHYNARDPWAATNFLPWCAEHAPADSWQLIQSEGSKR